MISKLEITDNKLTSYNYGNYKFFMKLFFQEQFSKIAWKRVFIIAFVWTVFAMQSERFRNYRYDTAGAIGYGVGHGGAAIIMLSIIGASTTKIKRFKKDTEA